jgi:predicted permease
MESLWKDFKYSARMLLKAPGNTAVSVMALALGIGLTTTMFSITYGVIHRGLPFEDSHRIMSIGRNNVAEDIQRMGVAVHDFLDWREQQTSFENLGGFYNGTVNVSGLEGRPERFSGAFMMAGGMDMLRVPPLMGRLFVEGEDQPGSPHVAILGYAVWQNHFGSDPDVIGRTVRMNGEVTTIVGVMPEGFLFPMNEQLWVPYRQNVSEMERGDGTWLGVFGRLKDGVSLEAAQAEFSTIAQRLAMEYPETNEGIGATIEPYTERFVGSQLSALLYTMLAAVFLVLVIACVNVANLLLARVSVRSKELAIRSALGAGRWRIVAQFLSETFTLAAVGAGLGLGIAWVGIRLFDNAVARSDPPYWMTFELDGAVLLFAITLTAIAAVMAGILPALKASGAKVNEILKDESRGTSSLRIGKLSKSLVVAEIAFSCGLLVAAGLMIKSVVNLGNLEFGFETENVMTARVGLFVSDYPDETVRLQFFEELVARLDAHPGVAEASLTSGLPTTGRGGRPNFAVEGEIYEADQDYPFARRTIITPNHFETFGVSVLQGRDFGTQDTRENLPVALVNLPFAERYFPGESPIGRRIRVGESDSEEPWLTIVGVVPDMYLDPPENEEPEGFYLPLSQNDARFLSIAVRAAGGDASALAPVLRDVVMAVDSDLPIYWVRTVAEEVAENTWIFKVFSALFVAFGAAALFLGAIGLYGVMAFYVSRRTQELGVRMALGAQTGDVMKLVLKQGLFQLGLGLFLGLGIAALLSRGLEVLLFEVEPWDPVIFFLIALMLFLVGMLATYVPARRATLVDPVQALRYE